MEVFTFAAVREQDRSIQFYEAQLKVDNNSMRNDNEGSQSSVRIQILNELPEQLWRAECGLTTNEISLPLIFFCRVLTESNGEITNAYFSDLILVELSEWYTARIEIEAETSTLRFYLDGHQIGIYTPEVSSSLIPSSFLPGIRVQHQGADASKVYVDNVYVDNVRISP